jgi:hypothetical protein
MSAVRKPRRQRRWGLKKAGLVVARRVRVEINFENWDWGIDWHGIEER